MMRVNVTISVKSHSRWGIYFIAALCPSFEDVPGDQKIRVGSTFEIEVKVKGYPRPEHVTWYKGEDIILKSRRINMQYLNGVAKLKVYDSCADDSGLYECVTENEHGNTTCRISVKIESVSFTIRFYEFFISNLFRLFTFLRFRFSKTNEEVCIK